MNPKLIRGRNLSQRLRDLSNVVDTHNNLGYFDKDALDYIGDELQEMYTNICGMGLRGDYIIDREKYDAAQIQHAPNHTRPEAD